jgi:catechol 2,3-dioxygenase-like lactoylglutathione lyase family enzyme
MTMDLNIHYAFLPHTDAEEALGFYRDLLGFELRNDVGYQGMRWLTVGPPDQPGTGVVLYPPEAETGLTDEERRTVAEMIAKGSYGRITFASHDLDGVFEQLAAAGVDVVEEPTDQPYGVRDCAVRDPTGNLIRINQLA